MLKSHKHVFWEAFFVTILIFGLGVFIGVVLENMRAKKVFDMYSDSDLNLLDIRVQAQILDLEDLNCKDAIEKNIEFGDRVYEDAKLIDRYELANEITDYIISEHKKNDLLRAIFWINSIKIKEKCGKIFHTVVYLYNYKPENLDQKEKQKVFSRYLEEMKSKYGNEIVLIPLAINMDLLSIDLLAKNYNVSDTSIIVDESLIVKDINDISLVEKKIR